MCVKSCWANKGKGLLALLLAVVLLSGCAKGTQNAAYSFQDDLGRTVTLQKLPERTAALLGSFAQIYTLAGGTVCAAPDDAWEDLALDLPEDAVNLGMISQLSLEQLLASQPDLILASANNRQNMQWQTSLEATGIPVAYFDVADFADYLRLLSLCTSLTGREDLYETYGTAVETQLNAVLDRSKERLKTQEPPKVLSMVASAAILKAKNSQDNVLGEMLKALGCINIADSDSSLLENLSMEHILLQDPDFIFFVQRGGDEAGMKALIETKLASDPLWSQLTAVKEGRVYYMDKTLFNLKPCQRWGEAYEILEDILCHGEP